MNILTIGIGIYGISVIETIKKSSYTWETLAIDINKNLLNAISIENKIQISKRFSAKEIVERIKAKLKKTVKFTDVVFIVTNPLDLPNVFVIPRIAEFLKSLGVLVIGVVVEPSAKIERKKRNDITWCINWITEEIAAVVIPQKVMHLYCQPNYQWYDAYISFYDGTDIVLEQDAFFRWYKNSEFYDADNDNEAIVGVFFIKRIWDMLQIKYPNATWNDVCRVMALPGSLHITEVVSSGIDRVELLRWRASNNKLLRSSLHGAKGQLFVLTVPSNTSLKEVGHICDKLNGFADELADFYFDIDVVDSDTDILYTKMIAINTYYYNENSNSTYKSEY